MFVPSKCPWDFRGHPGESSFQSTNRIGRAGRVSEMWAEGVASERFFWRCLFACSKKIIEMMCMKNLKKSLASLEAKSCF